MASNQLHQVAAIADDAAASNPVPVLPAPSAGADDVPGESEERDWANLVKDAVGVIAEKLLAIDVTEYIRLRAVCTPWRRSTAAHPTWKPCFYPKNWVMLHENGNGEDDDDVDSDDVMEDPAAPRRRRFVNVRTGTTLRIRLPSFDQFGMFLANPEGLLLFYCDRTETVRLFNPLTTATVIFPGLSGVPGLEEDPDLTAAGIVVDRRNAPAGGGPTIVPNVVLVLISPLDYSTMILCSKPGDDHWGTIDAGALEVQEGGLSLQGRFYIPTPQGDVLRVELYPEPHLLYVARPPDRALCRCHALNVTSYLVPSLDDETDAGEEENDGLLLVRAFTDDHIDVLRVHLGNGSYIGVPQRCNRTIFVPGLTLLTDKFPSLADLEGYVLVSEYIEDYIGNDV